MPEYIQINSLQIKLNIDDNINITGQYMEPLNDIIKACLNQIYNTAQQLLVHWNNSLYRTKSLSWTGVVEIIQRLQVQMCQQKHKAIDDKQKY